EEAAAAVTQGEEAAVAAAGSSSIRRLAAMSICRLRSFDQFIRVSVIVCARVCKNVRLTDPR
ncbi:hypothetical protein Dimus_030052, partial [Dionaea muscipula]